MSVAAISAAVPRVRTVVAGRVQSVRPLSRPWTRFEVLLADDTAAVEWDRLVMLNPIYTFLSDECSH
jgi:hypothetical protein